MEYNGWKNWETWLVNLWINNDPEVYDLALAINHETDDMMDPVQYVADELKESIMATWSDVIGNTDHWAAGLFSDLIGQSLTDVDWRTIAMHIRNDYLDRADYYGV